MFWVSRRLWAAPGIHKSHNLSQPDPQRHMQQQFHRPKTHTRNPDSQSQTDPNTPKMFRAGFGWKLRAGARNSATASPLHGSEDVSRSIRAHWIWKRFPSDICSSTSNRALWKFRAGYGRGFRAGYGQPKYITSTNIFLLCSHLLHAPMYIYICLVSGKNGLIVFFIVFPIIVFL